MISRGVGGPVETRVENSAVEKAGAWKPAKTKTRFPPAPTLPWKSRRSSEIPTFPPRRLRLLFYPKGKQRPNRKPKRRPDGRIALFHKADRSIIIKTGRLDLLTTAPWRGGEGVTILSDAVPYSPPTPLESLRVDAQPGARDALAPGAVRAAAVRLPRRGHQARNRLHAAELPDVD